jgi:hypothetical protein
MKDPRKANLSGGSPILKVEVAGRKEGAREDSGSDRTGMDTKSMRMKTRPISGTGVSIGRVLTDGSSSKE